LFPYCRSLFRWNTCQFSRWWPVDPGRPRVVRLSAVALRLETFVRTQTSHRRLVSGPGALTAPGPFGSVVREYDPSNLPIISTSRGMNPHISAQQPRHTTTAVLYAPALRASSPAGRSCIGSGPARRPLRPLAELQARSKPGRCICSMNSTIQVRISMQVGQTQRAQSQTVPLLVLRTCAGEIASLERPATSEHPRQKFVI
jgi:hypothetical protein